MVDEPAFASGDTSLLDLAPKPFVVVYRSRQKVQSNLIGGTSGFRGESGQFRFEFGRNLQVHRARVGGMAGSVNRRLVSTNGAISFTSLCLVS